MISGVSTTSIAGRRVANDPRFIGAGTSLRQSRVPARARRLLAALAVLAGTSLAGAVPDAPGPRAFALVAEAAADGVPWVGPDATYTDGRGFGFDLGTAPTPDGQPFFFSVALAEGNHRVTVTFGDAADASDNTVRAESRQLMLERVTTRAGESVTRTFVVNVRSPRIPPPPENAPGGSVVVLNTRERDLLRWDDKLTLEFGGSAPAVRSITIEPVDCPTLFLLGDSTVTDQPLEPAAGWGQMLPRFLKPDIAVANHAESGETLKSFLTSLRLAKVLSAMQPGDWAMIQFGHNDQKAQWPQTYAEAHTTYRAYLRTYIAEVRLRGATPVLVTSMQRRTFDGHGRIRNSHGAYPHVVREVADEEGVALVDLDRASTVFYEALGPARAPLAFSDGGRDATHHNNYGAYQLARCVIEALRRTAPALAAHIARDVAPFDPARPEDPAAFTLPPSRTVRHEKP